MAASQNSYSRSPNLSTRSYQSSSSSAASPKPLQSQYGSIFATTGGTRTNLPDPGSYFHQPYDYHQQQHLQSPPHHSPLQQHHSPHHQHLQQQQQHQPHHHQSPQPYSYTPVSAGSQTSAADSGASTPAGPSGYISLPPLHTSGHGHSNGYGQRQGHWNGHGRHGSGSGSGSFGTGTLAPTLTPVSASATTSTASTPASAATATATTATAGPATGHTPTPLTTSPSYGYMMHLHQQQQHHHYNGGGGSGGSSGGNVQKRAYRQRRKDPSCDSCRERKVKCDATETTSCTECSSRQVQCQFTKETNRRMSSMKQVQDLERKLERVRRENNELRRMLGGEAVGTSPEAAAAAATVSAATANGTTTTTVVLPAFGADPRALYQGRRQWRQGGGGEGPLSVFSEHARASLRDISQGIWRVPGPTPARTPSTETLAALPPAAMAESLLQAYQMSVHVLLPVLDWAVFQRNVSQMHIKREEAAAGRPSPSASFVALYLAVLAIGRLSIGTNSTDLPSADALADASRAAMPSPFWTNTYTLDDVSTMLLLSVFLNESNLRSAACTCLGSAIRMAQDLGLHLASSSPSPSSSSSSTCRRRVWWALYIMDRSLAVELGRPLLIAEEDCDVALPQEKETPRGDGEEEEGEEEEGGEGDTASEAVAGRRNHKPSLAMAVLHVARSYTALSRVLSRDAGADDDDSAGVLATFDRHLSSCLVRGFPACAREDGGDFRPLAINDLNGAVFVLHARLLLHRNNLWPACHGHDHEHEHDCDGDHDPDHETDPAGMQRTRAAVEQCAWTAQQTAALVARVMEGEGMQRATALVATHLFRCALFLLWRGLVREGVTLVRALGTMAAARRPVVAVACGRYLAAFVSRLMSKRVELEASFPLAGAGRGNSNMDTDPDVDMDGNTSPGAPGEALLWDKELLVMACADLVAMPGGWMWEATDEIKVEAKAEVDNRTVPGSSRRLSGPATALPKQARSRMGGGPNEESSSSWDGWEQLERQVLALEALPGVSQVDHTSASTTTDRHYTFRPPTRDSDAMDEDGLRLQRGPFQASEKERQELVVSQIRLQPPPPDRRSLAVEGRALLSESRGAVKSKRHERISIANII